MAGAASQSSVAVGDAGPGTDEQSAVVSAGQPDSTGACVSLTVTRCTHELELPHASVAVHVRTSTYESAQPPGSTSSTYASAGAAPQSSAALTAGGSGTASHEAAASAGQPEIAGGTSSTIVTVWTHVA